MSQDCWLLPQDHCDYEKRETILVKWKCISRFWTSPQLDQGFSQIYEYLQGNQVMQWGGDRSKRAVAVNDGEWQEKQELVTVFQSEIFEEKTQNLSEEKIWDQF